MNRSAFFGDIMPTNTVASPYNSSINSYREKTKDVTFIKNTSYEKLYIQGSPIKYFPIDLASQQASDPMANVFDDHTNLKLLAPIDMRATWTPQEYMMDLSKFGLIVPQGSDLQLYIHVNDIETKLGRKPLIGDIIDTEYDKQRYRISDVFFTNNNLWTNIFCMVTLTKATYDSYTSQLDQYDQTYKDSFTTLNTVLNDLTGETTHLSNKTITSTKLETNSSYQDEPNLRSISTATDNILEIQNNNVTDTNTVQAAVKVATDASTPITSTELDLMTMRL